MKKHPVSKGILAFLMLSLLGVCLQAQTKSKQPRTLTAREIAQKTFPAVVEITTEDSKGQPGSLGSGFFVQGYLIATNHHVIKGAATIYARIVGQKHSFKISRVERIDEAHDLALLRVEGFSVKPLPLGNSGEVRVGDEIYAVGNPEGFEGTFSQGIVSGLRRNNLIQITAPISHGSSGGPVLNKRGEVVAVASAFFQDGQNLNFAVRASYLAALLKWADSDTSGTIANGKGKARIIQPEEFVDSLVNDRSLSAKALFDKGYKLLYDATGKFQTGNAPAAKPYFEAAVRKDKDNAEAWYELGKCYFHDGELPIALALDKYIQAIRVNPSYVQAHKSLGMGYELCAIMEDPFDGKPLSNSKAISFYRKAADSYQEVTILSPNDAEIYIKLGEMLDKISQTAQADRAFSKALQLAPNDPKVLFSLGVTYYDLSRNREAINVLNKVVLLTPKDLAAYKYLGQAYDELGQVYQSNYFFQKAIENYKAAIQLSAIIRGDLHYQLGLVYLHMGDKSSALDEYRVIKGFGKKYDYQANKLFEAIYK